MKVLLLILITIQIGCSFAMTNSKEVQMDLVTLKTLLLEGSWDAVDVTKKLGEKSWSVLNEIVEQRKFRPKQIAMSCAAQLDEEKARDYLIKGLNDKHPNVNLRAAGELTRKPFKGALPYILKMLNACEDELDGECRMLSPYLIEALGHYPGKDSLGYLTKIIGENPILKTESLKTLVKLKDPSSEKLYLKILKNGDSNTKAMAIRDLIYINQKEYLPELKKLLLDKGIGLSVGTQYNPIQRRFCDEAVETAVKWLKLKPSFKVPGNPNYSDKQITEITSLIPN